MGLLTFSANFSWCSHVVRIVTAAPYWLSLIILGFYTWGPWGIAATANGSINALFQILAKFGLNFWITNDFFFPRPVAPYLEQLYYTEICLPILNYITIILKTYFLFHDHNGIFCLWVWFWESNKFADKISTFYSLKHKVVKLWVKDYRTVFLKWRFHLIRHSKKLYSYLLTIIICFVIHISM